MNLQKNTILITGGTSGFGLEFATKLIALGNTVIITGRNAEKLEAVKLRLPQVHIIQSDVSNAEDIINLHKHIIQHFPDLNVLINNAGEMRKISLNEAHDIIDLTREIEINLMGPIRMVQQFLPHLKKQQTATILNVTSGIALMAFPISPIYSASKSGLRAYTQSLRVQLRKSKIKVIELVAPGSSTPLNDEFINEDGLNASLLMPPGKLVDAAIRGMQKDKSEIFPGLAKILLILSSLATKLALNQASKMGASTMYGK